MDDEERQIRIKLRDEFCHYSSRCLKIRTKFGVDKFIMNRAQKYVHDIVEKQKRETGKVRVIILKGRQQGMSTLIGGRFYWLVTHNEGARAFILTHDSEATNNLFDMTQRYHQNCPTPVKPLADTSNAKEIYFGGLDSGYKVGTAGNKGVGRSSTIQYLHGCLAKGNKIFNPDTGGMKNIEDFLIGDYVLTHTGKIAPISFISNQNKTCLSVIFRTLGKFPLVATGEHEVWTKDGWKELKELNIGDSIGYPIKEIKEEIFHLDLPFIPVRMHGGGQQGIYPDKINLDYNFGRLVGLYIAEGHLKIQSASPFRACYVSFAVHRKESQRTIDWIMPFKEYFSSINIKHRENCLTTIVIIYGNRFATLINELCGRVKGKHIPYNWNKMPAEFCRGILHGYISGDGASYKESRRVKASSICHAITVSLRDMAASLGYGWAAIEVKEAGIRHGRNEKERYTFVLCGNGATKLAYEIGKPSPEITRKKVTSIKNYAATTTEISNGYAWLRIRSIEDAGIKEVYDFEVNHLDHSYCAIQGAVSNSEVAFWANAAEHSKGIMQAVPNARGTEIFLESTANGIGNYFHQQWQAAESCESDFIAIFVPWFWQDEYRREIELGFTKTDDELELLDTYKLDDEQLQWRRYKIAELSVSGANGVKGFNQEYPNNSVEAFILSGEDSFIQPELVMKARKSEAEKYGPLVIGVDPARFGQDRTCIIRRKGRSIFGLERYVKKDTMEIVGFVHKIILNESPDKVFIDIGGLGAGIVDRLHELGYKELVCGVNSGSTPLDQQIYLNKRSEMWGEFKKWLENEPCQIPDNDELHADICSTRYKFDSLTRLVMEPKSDMKKRGIRSSDCADACGLTFAYPINALVSGKKEADNKARLLMSNFKKAQSVRDDLFRR